MTLDDLETGTGPAPGPTAAELRLATGLTERRVRQLAAGIALVEALMARYGLSVTEVSDAGLREGAVLAEARFGRATGWRICGHPASPGARRRCTEPARRGMMEAT